MRCSKRGGVAATLVVAALSSVCEARAEMPVPVDTGCVPFPAVEVPKTIPVNVHGIGLEHGSMLTSIHLYDFGTEVDTKFVDSDAGAKVLTFSALTPEREYELRWTDICAVSASAMVGIVAAVPWPDDPGTVAFGPVQGPTLPTDCDYSGSLVGYWQSRVTFTPSAELLALLPYAEVDMTLDGVPQIYGPRWGGILAAGPVGSVVLHCPALAAKFVVAVRVKLPGASPLMTKSVELEIACPKPAPGDCLPPFAKRDSGVDATASAGAEVAAETSGTCALGSARGTLWFFGAPPLLTMLLGLRRRVRGCGLAGVRGSNATRRR